MQKARDEGRRGKGAKAGAGRRRGKGAKAGAGTKNPPRGRGGKRRGVSRGAVRKRRREKGDFAVSRRQSALTTTKGAGAAKPRRPRWGLRPAGRFAKRSGRTLVAPAGPAALFLALPSKSPASWCCAVRVREAAKAPVGPWTGWAVCKAERAHLCCARSPRPRILDEESTKSGPASLGGLGAALRVLCAKILRQNRRFLMPPRQRDRAPLFLKNSASSP